MNSFSVEAGSEHRHFSLHTRPGLLPQTPSAPDLDQFSTPWGSAANLVFAIRGFVLPRLPNCKDNKRLHRVVWRHTHPSRRRVVGLVPQSCLKGKFSVEPFSASVIDTSWCVIAKAIYLVQLLSAIVGTAAPDNNDVCGKTC